MQVASITQENEETTIPLNNYHRNDQEKHGMLHVSWYDMPSIYVYLLVDGLCLFDLRLCLHIGPSIAQDIATNSNFDIFASLHHLLIQKFDL